MTLPSVDGGDQRQSWELVMRADKEARACLRFADSGSPGQLCLTNCGNILVVCVGWNLSRKIRKPLARHERVVRALPRRKAIPLAELPARRRARGTRLFLRRKRLPEFFAKESARQA